MTVNDPRVNRAKRKTVVFFRNKTVSSSVCLTSFKLTSGVSPDIDNYCLAVKSSMVSFLVFESQQLAPSALDSEY